MKSHNGIMVQGVFFNTTHESGETLADNMMVALTQNNIIHEMFQVWPKMSPSQVWQRYTGFCTNQLGMKLTPTPPLTSIRRAITTLEHDNVLERCDNDKNTGIYGRSEFYWELKTI